MHVVNQPPILDIETSVALLCTVNEEGVFYGGGELGVADGRSTRLGSARGRQDFRQPEAHS